MYFPRNVPGSKSVRSLLSICPAPRPGACAGSQSPPGAGTLNTGAGYGDAAPQVTAQHSPPRRRSLTTAMATATGATGAALLSHFPLTIDNVSHDSRFAPTVPFWESQSCKLRSSLRSPCDHCSPPAVEAQKQLSRQHDSFFFKNVPMKGRTMML